MSFRTGPLTIRRFFMKSFGKIAGLMLATISLSTFISSCAEDSGSSSSNSADTSSAVDAETFASSDTANANGYIAADLYENFSASETVYITLNGTSATARLGSGSEVSATSTETSIGTVSSKDITIVLTSNTAEDESSGTDAESNGLSVQYKGDGKIKYVISGTFTGTLFIKNKKADAAVVLNNAKITSDSGSGPALRFSSQNRTFIVIPAGTESTITDTRVLDQSATMYDTKKGSIYAKGALIFTGESSSSSGGVLSVVNKGFKHAIYSKDYVRVANITLNSTVEGTKGRDCIRSLTGVIIDGGTIKLTGNGTVTDDESVGIKVEGEDADEDELTVEYTAGAGFVIINGGKITINTVAKGITAHWKSSESAIGNAAYTATANESLLYTTFLNGTSASRPNPFVEINGGTIDITTTGTPYENSTASCSPEGIEAKGNMTINAGTITLSCTDDAINAGGSIVINGGAIYAYSSQNDAIDANGTSGITINGGTIVALGVTTPECAFDCDSYPLKITGGLLVGLGTNNYTAPTNCTQSTAVLSSSIYGSGGTTMAITDASGTPVFAYRLPSSAGSVMILSSPNIKTGSSYTVKTGVSASGGTAFHGLYTTLPSISGGTSTDSFSTSSSSCVYTSSGASSNGGPQEGTKPTTPGAR